MGKIGSRMVRDWELLGVYLRQEQRTKAGQPAPALRSYVNGWRGNGGRALVRAGYLLKEPSGELHVSHTGMEIVRRFISSCKYAHENYRNSARRDQDRMKKR